MSFDGFVAKRYLLAKRKQAFIVVISIITLLGITVGVAALNLALAVQNGWQKAFLKSLIGDTGELYLVAGGGKSSGFNTDDIRKIEAAIAQLDGVAAYSMAREEHAALFSMNSTMGFCKVHGILPAQHRNVSNSLNNMQEGDPSDLDSRPPDSRPGIILGKDLAGSMGLRVGDEVMLGLPRVSSPGLSRNDIRIKRIKYEVVGIFQTGNSQIDRLEAYVLLDTLLLALNTTEVQVVHVRFDDLAKMDQGKEILIASSELPNRTLVVDLRDFNQGLFEALKMEKMVTAFIFGLIVLVVALNMISTLVMLVMEKHRDIGIMKAFGTPKPVILRIFIRQGMILSTLGTTLGTILGFTLAVVADRTQLIKLDNSVYEVLSYLPFEVHAKDVLLVAIGSLLVSFFSTLYPATQAALLDPVEALKYD